MATIKLKEVFGIPKVALNRIEEVTVHDGRIFIGETMSTRVERTQVQAIGSIIDALRTTSSATIYMTPKPRPKAKPRWEQWSDACSEARSGLESLNNLKEEFGEWKENLGDKFEGSSMKDKLETIDGLDIDSAISVVDEAEGCDLPVGFGRD